jgi:hypothetical protein
MAKALYLRRRTRRLRRRMARLRRRTHRPFWSMPWLRQYRPRRRLNCHRPATPEFRIDKESN